MLTNGLRLGKRRGSLPVTETVIGLFTERENSIKRFQGEIKFNCEHSRSVEHLNGDITIQKTGT